MKMSSETLQKPKNVEKKLSGFSYHFKNLANFKNVSLDNFIKHKPQIFGECMSRRFYITVRSP